MRTATVRRTLAAALLYLPLGACAHMGNRHSLQELNVQVTNDLASGAEVKVYAQQENGPAENIGNVSAGSKTLLKWVPGNPKATYMLIAEPAGAAPIKSQTFTPGQVTDAMASWMVSANSLTFGNP